jgi:hypothetical protein
VHELNAGDQSNCGPERFEPHHRPHPPFDRAVVLLDGSGAKVPRGRTTSRQRCDGQAESTAFQTSGLGLACQAQTAEIESTDESSARMAVIAGQVHEV